jgi:hypothetical protein
LSIAIALAACGLAWAQTATQPIPQKTPAAQTTPTPAPARGPSGDNFLMRAAAQLDRHDSICARLRHRVAVNGQELYGVGSYWQQGSGEELKVRLELQLAGQDAKLLQVSNSWFLWIDRLLPTGRTIIRYNLRQLRADPALTPPDLDKLDPGKANWTAIQPLLLAHSGGLPSLLASLNENFHFLPPQPMRLAIEPPAGGQPTNVAVFAIVGQWKPEKLAALLAKSGDPAKEAASKKQKAPKIPERIPQEVLLLVGQADLFPYRIEYRQLETPVTTNPNGPPIPYQLSNHPLAVLELSDVVFDAQIPAGQFDYMAPKDADWVDQTAVLIERVKRKRPDEVATRAKDQAALPSR